MHHKKTAAKVRALVAAKNLMKSKITATIGVKIKNRARTTAARSA